MKQTMRTYILLLVTMFIASCSSEMTEENLPDALSEYEEGIVGIMPELIDGNIFGGSRNALTYDRNVKNILFTWSNDASIGVFMKDGDADNQQQEFVVVPSTINGLRARFSTPSEVEMNVQKSFISYSHYNKDFVPYTQTKSYPVFFDGQKAASNSKMFYHFTNNNTEFAKAEVYASEHLDAYDYLTAGAMPETETHLNLQFSRMESIVRFYLKSPAPEKFDSLQLVVVDNDNQTPLIIKGNLDMETGIITGDGSGCLKNKVQTLELGDGYNMNFNNQYRAGEPTYPDSEYYYKTVGYIVAFMAMAPVDLTDAEHIFLYLISNDGAGNKKYYKSVDLAKPNLTPNLFYQWTYGNKYTDEPIEFQPVTVQVWENDVLNNDGKGTEGW